MKPEKLIQVEQAKYFAIGCHGEQKRKYTNEPYWAHCQGVVELLSQYYPYPEAYVVGWLHDVVEDTWATCFDIEEHFNKTIAQYVSDLTMPSIEAGNRAYRMKHYNETLANACELVQTVKYADLIHNSASIEKFDPDFAHVYLKEKKELLAVVNKGEPRLYKMACTQCGFL